MHFHFESLSELKAFIAWINQDKDDMIKEASKELNTESDNLKRATDGQTINQGKIK